MDERLNYEKIDSVVTVIGWIAMLLDLFLTNAFLEETTQVILIASIVVVVVYIIKIICWMKTYERRIISLICYIVVILAFSYLGFLMITAY